MARVLNNNRSLVTSTVAGGVGGMITGAHITSWPANSIGISVGGTVGAISGAVTTTVNNNKNNQQRAGKVLFDRSITKDYKKRNIDPNVSKSVISTINTHQLTDFKVKDNKNRETVSGKINKYASPLYKFKGVDARGINMK